MIQSWKGWRRNIELAMWLAIALSIASSNSVLAQITPDGTLPTNSDVKTEGNVRTITGGTQAGSNLFHSFEQFSVPTGSEAYFNNAINIQNIFSRVTGRSVSDIDGLIRANGTANLFLINPNGILFGRNASLNIGGSFLASTASSLKFADGTEFNTASPQTTPLLTISAPIGLQIGTNPGNIRNQSRASVRNDRVGLSVQPGKTLGIVGGEINLEGGRLTAPGGRVELGSVAEPGFVSLNLTNNGYRLGYEGIQNFQDIRLSRRALVNASGGARNARDEGGGDIQAQGRTIQLSDGSHIRADTLGKKSGGTVTINASEALEVIGTSADGEERSSVTTETRGDGNAGALSITTKRLSIQNGAVVSTSSSLSDGTRVNNRGRGAAGTLTIQASDLVEVIGERVKNPVKNSVQSRLISLTGGRGVNAKAGDLTITTRRLIVQGGAQISAGTFPQTQGSGGALTVNASDVVEVSGISVGGDEVGRITNSTFGDGDAKTLTINTRQLKVQNGGLIAGGAFSRDGDRNGLSLGNGGSLIINALDAVEVIGRVGGIEGKDPTCATTCLTTVTEGLGRAGNLTINTGKLLVQGGAQVASGTRARSEGQGGDLTVNAGLVQVAGESVDGRVLSRITNRTSGQGDVSNLVVNTGKLILEAGGQINSDTLANGSGGNLTVNASDSVEVVGKAPRSSTGSRLSVSANSDRLNAGRAGDLTITTPKLSVRNGAEVSVSGRTQPRQEPGEDLDDQELRDAGNILINTRELRLDEQGGITATSGRGTGGDVLLQSLDLLLLRRGSRISATAGAAGTGGNIDINARLIVAISRENSDITADAFEGEGGDINIKTQGIFGIEERDRGTSLSDITASSEFGIDGNITLSTPDIDPNRGLLNLPDVPVDTRLVQGCSPGSSQARNEFIVTGRGGLPTNPNESLSTDALQVGLVTLNSQAQSRNSATHSIQPTRIEVSPPERIVEAQGWRTDRNGKVMLVAQAPTATPEFSGSSPSHCLISTVEGR
jgi:filamentous hemagglutinin family protein